MFAFELGFKRHDGQIRSSSIDLLSVASSKSFMLVHEYMFIYRLMWDVSRALKSNNPTKVSIDLVQLTTKQVLNKNARMYIKADFILPKGQFIYIPTSPREYDILTYVRKVFFQLAWEMCLLSFIDIHRTRNILPQVFSIKIKLSYKYRFYQASSRVQYININICMETRCD